MADSANSVETLGYHTLQELGCASGFPSAVRLEQGACAVIECIQEIPCNPCETACPNNAIKIGNPITNLPVLDADRCTGCGVCIAQCPGLAIFVVDMGYSARAATVAFPHEFLPLPNAGDRVAVVDRTGAVIGDAEVLGVHNPPANDSTAVVRVLLDKRLAQHARGLARGESTLG